MVTKLEWESVRRQKPLAAADKGEGTPLWNLHTDSCLPYGWETEMGPNGKRLALKICATNGRAGLLLWQTGEPPTQ